MMSSPSLESTPVERQAVQPAVPDNDGPPLARVLDIRQRFACVLPAERHYLASMRAHSVL